MSTSHVAAPRVLQYDSHASEPARYASAAAPMFWLAICSGLCVGVCFLGLRGGLAAAALHLIVFAMTLALAVVAQLRLSAAGAPADRRVTYDAIAGAGLVGVGLAALGPEFVGGGRLNDGATALLGLAFLLMGATTVRHVILYRMLADDCDGIARAALGRNLRMLGRVKAVYEGLWLGCCGATLLVTSSQDFMPRDVILPLAVASLFGSFGFALIWLWMIAAHATFYAATRRRRPGD